MSEDKQKKMSMTVMMYFDDVVLLDKLVEMAGAANSNIVELGQTHGNWDARKRLLDARKKMLHQLIVAAPKQFADSQTRCDNQMSDTDLLRLYESAPENPAIITAIVERWVKAQKSAALPLQSGDDIYYADMEKGTVEHGVVYIAAYKNGSLDSFSINFDNGDFDEFVGSGLGTHFFRTEAEAKARLKQGEPV